MMPNDKLYIFDSYNDEELAARIKYWSSVPAEDTFNVLATMYKEQERRVDEKLLAWVESK